MKFVFRGIFSASLLMFTIESFGYTKDAEVKSWLSSNVVLSTRHKLSRNQVCQYKLACSSTMLPNKDFRSTILTSSGYQQYKVQRFLCTYLIEINKDCSSDGFFHKTHRLCDIAFIPGMTVRTIIDGSRLEIFEYIKHTAT